MKSNKCRKRHFLLLEVMVAVFLILLCAVPALQIYMNMYKEQAKVVRFNQRDHLVHLVHAKITEQLYKRLIPLDEILASKQAKFADADLQMELDRLGYEASYELSVLHPKAEKGQEKASEYLCRLAIKMKETSRSSASSSDPKELNYDYLVYLARKERRESGDRDGGGEEQTDISHPSPAEADEPGRTPVNPQPRGGRDAVPPKKRPGRSRGKR